MLKNYIISKLLPKIGFANTVRASAYIVLGFLVLGNCLVRTVYQKRGRSEHPLRIKALLFDIPYLLAILG